MDARGTGERVPCAVAINDILRPVVSRESGWTDEPVELEVRRPDGTLLPQRPGDASFTIELGAPVGPYTVTARQGGRTATGVAQVVSQLDAPVVRAEPALGANADVVFRWEPLPAGISIQVTVAGLAPGQDVRLVLYRGSSGLGFTFQSVIGTVRANARGEASYLLRRADDDPPGIYAIQTVPTSRGVAFPVGHGAQFCLSRSRDVDDCGSSLEVLAQGVVTDANRTLNAAMDRDGAPIGSLACAFADEALALLMADVQDFRARGEYQDARLVSPIRVLSARNFMEPGERFEATVVEEWDTRTYDRRDMLIGSKSGPHEWRYVFMRQPSLLECGSGWRIVEVQKMDP
jgi:hypothetical protein